MAVMMEVQRAGSDVKCCPLEPERWTQRASVPFSTQLQRCIVYKAEMHFLPCIPHLTKRMDSKGDQRE
eukprot:9135578-Ditylum_brightwellii.AAC.1